MFVTRRSREVTTVIAHRGASRAHPENTLAAFQAAAAMGADMVELDVRRSLDGVLIVHHDAVLPDGRPVAATRAVDRPAWVPTLDEALEACAGLAVNVEIKNHPDEPGYEADRRLADDVVAVVRARGDGDRVLVSSFDQASLERLREVDPGIAVAWLVVALQPDVVTTLVERDYQALHPWWQAVTVELLERCDEVGVAVHAWTCDDPAAMLRLAGWGIDGICTNVPDVARAALGR